MQKELSTLLKRLKWRNITAFLLTFMLLITLSLNVFSPEDEANQLSSSVTWQATQTTSWMPHRNRQDSHPLKPSRQKKHKKQNKRRAHHHAKRHQPSRYQQTRTPYPPATTYSQTRPSSNTTAPASSSPSEFAN